MHMESKDIQVFYPIWTKALLLVALPLLFGCVLWLGLRPLLEEDLTNAQVILSLLLAGAVGYQGLICARCLKYLGVVLVLCDHGLERHQNGTVTEYSWDELTVTEYAFATTTQIKTEEGATIGYFSQGLPNLALLVEVINNGTT